MTDKSLKAYRPQRVNANKHRPFGLSELTKSIQRDGYSAPMVAAADGEVFAGSARLEKSAEVFGIDVEPIIVESDGTRPIIHVRTDIPNADDPRARRLGVADNIIAKVDYEPDGAILALLAADDAAIAALVKADDDSTQAILDAANGGGGDGDAEPEIDRAAELLEKWQVKTGDLWRIGEHRLLCGDSTKREDVERVMGGEKASICFTSPPYPGAEMWKEEGDKLIDVGNKVLEMVGDIVIEGGALVWNTSDIPLSNEGYVCNSARDTLKAVSLGWRKRGEIIWSKSMSYLPPPPFTRRPTIPNNTHEFILYFINGQWKPREKHGTLSQEEMTWNREDIWKISTESAKKAGHIAPFPEELAFRCITLWSIENELVYEPFAGSGTTLVACQNLHRKCRAIEISPAYCAVILERMSTAFPSLTIERLP